MDLGSSDGVLVCYQKLYSLVRLAKLEPWSNVMLRLRSDIGPGVKSWGYQKVYAVVTQV